MAIPEDSRAESEVNEEGGEDEIYICNDEGLVN